MDTKSFTLGSFEYLSESEMEEAKSEQAKIEKLDEQLKYDNPTMVYSVYTKIIERHMLKTPEGLLYLLRLQNYLDDNQKAIGKEIPAVPLADFYAKNKNDEAKEALEPKRDITQKAVSKKVQDANKETQEKVIVYKVIIVFLIVAIVAMLGISMASNSPNIINYRKQIENEYADWEIKLNEKEQELNARERELNGY